jgi:hypothetical protein
MSMMTWSGQNNNAQKTRLTSASRAPEADRAAAEPAREFHLGSGDKLGENSFAIYRDETLFAEAPH